MNEYQMLAKFCEIANEHIESLDADGLNYDLLKYGFDEQGPCCSDHEFLRAFSDNCDLNQNELYSIIEKICLEFISFIKKAST